MAHKSPTSLNTPRNIALQKGVVPSKLAEPETGGVRPITHPTPPAAKPVFPGAPQTQPSPFTNLKNR